MPTTNSSSRSRETANPSSRLVGDINVVAYAINWHFFYSRREFQTPSHWLEVEVTVKFSFAVLRCVLHARVMQKERNHHRANDHIPMSTATRAQTAPLVHEVTHSPPSSVHVFSNASPTEEIPIYLQEKIGSRCCFILCDYRRAVIWANSLFVGWATFLLLSKSSVVELSRRSVDDDELSSDIADLVDDYYGKRSISLGVTLGTALLSQMGAVRCMASPVALHAIMLVADFITLSFLAMDHYHSMQALMFENGFAAVPPTMGCVLYGVLTVAFLYPQTGYLLECYLGILSLATYRREDYCILKCCSTPKSQNSPPNEPNPSGTLGG